MIEFDLVKQENDKLKNHTASVDKCLLPKLGCSCLPSPNLLTIKLYKQGGAGRVSHRFQPTSPPYLHEREELKVYKLKKPW